MKSSSNLPKTFSTKPSRIGKAFQFCKVKLKREPRIEAENSKNSRSIRHDKAKTS